MLTGKSNYTIRWFRSIVFLLFPCILLCVLVCAYMIYISKQNVLEINSTITSHVQKNMDSRLKELNRYALTIEISSSNTVLKNLHSHPDTMPKQAYKLADTLHDYLITNSFVSNIYIYYPKSDLVVGDNGCFASNLYYILQGYPDNSGYQNWLDTLKSAKGMSVQELPFQKGQNLCFINTMKTDNANTAIIVFEIDYDQLLQAFEPGETADVLSIGILKKEKLIASVGNPDSMEDIGILYSNWENNKKNTIKIKDTYAFFYASMVPDLTYVTLYTARQLKKALYFPLAAALTGIILCAVIGIAGAVRISIRNGRPMENLLTILGKKSTSEGEDYQFILNKFQQMTEEKYKSEEFMQKHQTLLNSIFLFSLLQENGQNENEIFAETKYFEVSLEAPIYQIIILVSEQKKIPDFALEADALHEYLDQVEYSNLITSYHHRYVILLNTDEPISEPELRQMVEMLQKLAFPECFSTAAVGSWCDNMSEIVNSYHNALTALRNTSSTEGSVIVYYTESGEDVEHGNTDLMQLFSSLIYSGQFLKARQLFPQLNREYLYHENMKTETLRQSALMNLLIDAAYTVLPKHEAAKEVDILLKCTGSGEAYQQADILLKHLQNCVASQNDNKASIAAQAKQYIDENFTDPMLGLYLVSDRLGVSNSYLSATFKKVYGVNVIQYINQLRIEQAKVLILNTRKNIKEIAQEVGFSSDINFIRVFKKMENQTPTMLRKQTASTSGHITG